MSDAVASSIITGIISGIVTAGLIWAFRELWLRSLQPKIENMLYSDARIDGRWRGSLQAVGDIEDIAVTQVGHHVTGIARCIEGPDVGSSYRLAGEFRNMILTISYSSEDRSALDRGTFTMKLTNNGTKFVGRCLYYFDDDESVGHSEYAWERQKS